MKVTWLLAVAVESPTAARPSISVASTRQGTVGQWQQASVASFLFSPLMPPTI